MSTPPPITTFAVVPLLTDNGIGVQNCSYYATPVTNQSQPISPPLTSSGTNPSLIRIQQVPYNNLPLSLRTNVDQNATLYAAVAASFGSDLGLPVFVQASAALSVVIPTADQTTRGVILIFSTLGSTSITLRPTTDPQIKNGSDG